MVVKGKHYHTCKFVNFTHPSLVYLALSITIGIPSGTSPTKNSILVAKNTGRKQTVVTWESAATVK